MPSTIPAKVCPRRDTSLCLAGATKRRDGGWIMRRPESVAGDKSLSDFMRLGGVTGWIRAAAIAGAVGIPMSTHLYPEVAAHVMSVTETAHWLEWQD